MKARWLPWTTLLAREAPAPHAWARPIGCRDGRGNRADPREPTFLDGRFVFRSVW